LNLTELSEPAILRELVSMPEGDMVERKRSADHNTLAKAVSGFANASGGWLLLGIDDDGGLVGWQPSGRAHIRDWLRDVLDNYLDPLPHFEAKVFVLDKAEVGVVRVPRSAAAPHFMKLTGEVFERRNGQTRRASPARARQLLLRGDGGGHDAARTRLDDRQVALDFAMALDAPRESRAMHALALASIVRISLIEPSDVLTAWVHDTEAMRASETHQDRRQTPAPRTLEDRRFAAQTPHGETGTRTRDTTIFSRVLYQLSYLAADPILPAEPQSAEPQPRSHASR
jgi:hypothetical protein